MSKTIFCDIDGTIFKHQIVEERNKVGDLLPGVKTSFRSWIDNGHTIILTTGRKESERESTELLLNKNGIVYDFLLMGLPRGERIIINDKKTFSSNNRALGINVIRDSGLEHVYIDNTSVMGVDSEKLTKEKIVKPWGHELLLEVNDKYVVKELFMKKGHRCSLQYHKLKTETVYVTKGKLKLTIGDNENKLEEKILEPGDFVNIPSGKIHRMMGETDCTYIEASTNQLYDVVRLKDDYNRN